MRVNGLYGHVRRNDLRSILLFAGFVAAFHALAILALIVPLAMFDPAHAPVYDWGGYLVRWVPILTLAGAVLFAVQMAWHVRTVRRRTDFRFVDSDEEPRLCGIVEPLAIAAGLPTPYVGIIESPAMNAFACGIRRKDAVLVFTRGLVDGLDDDELAAVAAHEIVHIVNGDIRLIAATNVCLDTLWVFQPRRHPKQVNRVWEALCLPVFALLLPLMLVLILVVCFLRRLAVDGSRATRHLIASAREFIADAEAARLTQNPAALVSALRRIDGRSAILGLAAGEDAMMIDSAHEGAFATHPTIAARIAAIIEVTGSMAMIAPSRRDTRPAGLRAGGGFGRRPEALPEAALARSARRNGGDVLARTSSGDGFNRLGLTREMSLGAIAALFAFVWMHGADLTRPSALAEAFDPVPVRTFLAMGGAGMKCQVQGLAWLAGLAEEPTLCNALSVDGMLAAHEGEDNLLGLLAGQRAGVREGMHRRPDGTFRSGPTPEMQLAEVRNARCFQTESYSVGDRGLHSVDEVPDDHDTISLPRYLSLLDAAAGRAAASADGDAALEYYETRKRLTEVVHRFFGEPGLEVLEERFSSATHEVAVARLREREADSAFAADRDAIERMEITLLAVEPEDFISCTARRARMAAARERLAGSIRTSLPDTELALERSLGRE